jgi:hypothetical protein
MAGVPPNGTYDLTFALFDDRGAGSQIGDTVTNANVAISNGVFTVELDFTAKPFDGTALWLEVGVRSIVSIGPSETLTPRQPVTPVPYALRAINATTAASADAAALATNATTAATATAVPWSGITSRPGGLDDGDNDTLYSNGAGLTLTGTQFSLDTVFTDTLYWKLGGNAGTTPGVNFVGTTDNQALELKVNNARVLRLEPNATSPNVIGGNPDNSVVAGVFGATIGGGATNYIQNDADFGTIGGGWNAIQANADYATISGGWSNVIAVANVGGVIGGGMGNLIQSNTVSATIAGGYTNLIQLDTDYSAIGGGYYNIIETNADFSTIAGGYHNII